MSNLYKEDIKIKNFKCFFHILEDQAYELVVNMKKVRPAEMVFIPDFENPNMRVGLLCEEYSCEYLLIADQVVEGNCVDGLYVLRFNKGDIYRYMWPLRQGFNIPFLTARWYGVDKLWEKDNGDEVHNPLISGYHIKFDVNTPSEIQELKNMIKQVNTHDIWFINSDEYDDCIVGIMCWDEYSWNMSNNSYIKEFDEKDGLFMFTIKREDFEAFMKPYVPQIKKFQAEKKQNSKKNAELTLEGLMRMIRENLDNERPEEAPCVFDDDNEKHDDPVVEQKEAKKMSEELNKKGGNKQDKLERFVFCQSPADIEAELNERVVGQSELTKAAADFLYYHAMRQITPILPPRPMMIAGPSGSGKTEVWRVIKNLYGNLFNIKIVDASRITQEGWKGDEKLSSIIDRELVDGGILILDEFDKFARPKYSGNSNVSADMQAELLKALEGEMTFTTGNNRIKTVMNTKSMGFVFVGAFEELRDNLKRKHDQEAKKIGFGNVANFDKTYVVSEISDEDYIEYGVLTEVVGRVATKVTTNELSDDDYIKIINSPHSRVTQLRAVLANYCDNLPAISEKKIRELIATSKTNKTGVRWVSSQVENMLLEAIHTVGLRKKMGDGSVDYRDCLVIDEDLYEDEDGGFYY